MSQFEICFPGFRLNSLAPSITYHSCRDVANLYSKGYIQETWLTSDTAPVICRGFLFGASCLEAPKAADHVSWAALAAVKVMRILTGEEPEDYGPDSGKDKAAQELGRKGGKKRAEGMTDEACGNS